MSVSKVFLLAVASVALLFLLLGQAEAAYPTSNSYPPQVSGKYRRTACHCTSAANDGERCDDNWGMEYDILMSDSYTSFRARAIDRPSGSFTASVGSGGSNNIMSFNSGILGATMQCTGSLAAGFVCRRPSSAQNPDEEVCRVAFGCESGPCLAYTTGNNIRSIMYPIVGAILGITWFLIAALPFLSNLLKSFSSLIVLGLSGLQFLLMFFILMTPATYYGLMFMFAACLQIFAAQKGTKGYWQLCAGVAIWSLLALLGMNYFMRSHRPANWTLQTKPVPFDFLYEFFVSRSCNYFYGLTDNEPRCGGYLAFGLWILSFSIFLQPIVVFMSVLNWGSSSKD